MVNFSIDLMNIGKIRDTVALPLLGLTAIFCEADLRTHESFNDGWVFGRYGDMPDGSIEKEPDGMELPGFNDTAWRKLDLPHDWAVEGPFRKDLPNRTGKLPYAGTGWYRKWFTVGKEEAGKRFYLDIDGAMSNSTVWLNGQVVGEWPYGYTSYRLDLTDAVVPGQQNLLAIRLDNKDNSSRWYPGGGIYRNTWLVKTGQTHVDESGIFVAATDINRQSASLVIQVGLANHAPDIGQVLVKATIYPADKDMQPATREPVTVLEPVQLKGAITRTTLKTVMLDPVLWDLKQPMMYIAKVEIYDGEKKLDEQTSRFGIRSIEYSASDGFHLNGKRVRMNGVCMHHDLGPLGSAVNRRAIERQIEILKEMGVNAIRTAHNPPAPELVELCDQMGILLIVEAFDTWTYNKTDNDYGNHFAEWHERDLGNMVRRYRNNPSVVMWSTGNEVREQTAEGGSDVSLRLREIIRELDPTRPVTVGVSKENGGFNGFQDTVDVFGYNYKPHAYAEFREKNLELPLYGSETASCVSSRGEYFFPVIDEKDQGFYQFHVSSYDLYAPPWASKPDIEFEGQDRNPFVIGEFVWTGFDYLGEPTPYNNDQTNLLNFQSEAERIQFQELMEVMGDKPPSRSSYFGIVDLCGFKKDRFYLYQSRWRPELPMVHILPHWNWPDRVGEVTPVHVYTSGDEAELFLNGQSLGRKRKEQYEYRLRWDDVRYEPGELAVVAYKDGRLWAEDTVQTTGEPAAIRLDLDRDRINADGRDLCFVTVEVVDEKGRKVPDADLPVVFSLAGGGEIIATGNGDPTNLVPFQSTERSTFNGKALAIVQSSRIPGDLVLSAKVKDLPVQHVVITTVAGRAM